jgi:hypothetical protein
MVEKEVQINDKTHLLFATRHGRLHFLSNHFLLLTVGNLLCGGGDGFLFKLLGFGICAQIFVCGCCTSGDGRCSYIRS